MGYRKITNLQLDHPIFLFKEVYAMEKIHGTSAHITFHRGGDGWFYRVFAGGIKHNDFLFMLNSRYNLPQIIENLTAATTGKDINKITIYGEGYGGKCQNMGDTYGPLNFVAFEVEKDDQWFEVSRAAAFCNILGLPFVFYEKGPATIEWLEAQRDRPSEQAKRNGMGDDKKSEGVVVRAPMELMDVNGGRLIAKFKRADFRETKTARLLTEEDLRILQDAEQIAEEWVVEERLNHVLSALVAQGHHNLTIRDTGLVVAEMIKDVGTEALGKIEWSEAAGKAIGRKAAELFKKRLRSGGVINPIENITAPTPVSDDGI